MGSNHGGFLAIVPSSLVLVAKSGIFWLRMLNGHLGRSSLILVTTHKGDFGTGVIIGEFGAGRGFLDNPKSAALNAFVSPHIDIGEQRGGFCVQGPPDRGSI